MAGILKSIQKKGNSKPQKQAEREGFLTLVGTPESLNTQRPPATDFKKASAEQLLAELIEESDAVQIGSSPSSLAPDAVGGTKVVRRHQVVRAPDQSIEIKDNSLPDWTKPISKLPQYLEAVFLEVVKRVNRGVSEIGKLPSHKEEIFRHVIGELNEELSTEAKLSWKDQDLLERELKNVTSIEICLGQLLSDEHTTELFCDSFKSVKARRKGQIIDTPFCFRNSDEYELFINSIFSSVEKILSGENPILETSLRATNPSNTVWVGAVAHAVHHSLTADSDSHLTIKTQCIL